MWSWLIILPIAVGAGFGLSRLFGLFQVRGDSMRPSLREGDWVLARRLLRWERGRKGEVVIVVRDSHPLVLIKRIACGPGEETPAELRGALDAVPAGCYLLAGDNPDLRTARRYAGPVAAKQVWGRAWMVVWPWPRRSWLRRGRALSAEQAGRETLAAGASDTQGDEQPG